MLGNDIDPEERVKIDEVAEEWRQRTGSESVHLSLGPNATAENIREILEKIGAENSEFDQFTELEQAKALIHRLKKNHSTIYKIHQRKLDEVMSERERKISNEVFRICDMIPDRTPEDLVWLKEQKTKWGRIR